MMIWLLILYMKLVHVENGKSISVHVYMLWDIEKTGVFPEAVRKWSRRRAPVLRTLLLLVEERSPEANEKRQRNFTLKTLVIRMQIMRLPATNASTILHHRPHLLSRLALFRSITIADPMNVTPANSIPVSSAKAGYPGTIQL